MPDLGTGFGILGAMVILVLTFTLLVLIILMPVFVYLMYQDIKRIRIAIEEED